MQETQSKRKHNHYDIVDLMGESRRFQIGWSLLWVDHCHVYWVDKWKVYFEVEFNFGSKHLSQPEIMSWPKKKTSLCFWVSLTSAVAPTVSTQTGYNLKNLEGPWSRNRTIWGCSGKMWLWQLTQSSTRTTTGLCPCRMTSLCWSLLNLLIWTSTLRPAWRLLMLTTLDRMDAFMVTVPCAPVSRSSNIFQISWAFFYEGDPTELFCCQAGAPLPRAPQSSPQFCRRSRWESPLKIRLNIQQIPCKW